MTPSVLVVTGLSSAIGAAWLKRLAPDAALVALGRTAVTDERVTFMHADFRKSPDQWRASLAGHLDQHRLSVSGFVHLAGLVFSDTAEGTTLAEWEDMIAVNLRSAFFLGQTLSPYWAPSASVVLMASVDAYQASLDGPAAAYGAGKAGLMGLVRHWAVEWGGRGVRVNGIGLGALGAGTGAATPHARRAIADRTALRRPGEADEAAAAIQFLLSRDASYITGAWIAVDGGLNLAY